MSVMSRVKSSLMFTCVTDYATAVVDEWLECLPPIVKTLALIRSAAGKAGGAFLIGERDLDVLLGGVGKLV